MRTLLTQRWIALATLLTSVGVVGVRQEAHAGQPLTKVAGSWLRDGMDGSAPNALHTSSSRLDLAAPALAPADSLAAAMPTATRSKIMASLRSPNQTPGFGTAVGGAFNGSFVNHEPGEALPSRAQTLAQNYRSEGLPLAKLWQTKDALVHIGLNNKGKPGLWLVEKLH